LLATLGGLGVVAVLCFEHRLWPLLGNGTMLLLTLASVCLVLACHLQVRDVGPRPIPGTGWLRSCGRLSYEIYLTHMFVVWPVVRAFKASGAGLWWGILWYPPAVALSWLLGWLVARYLSVPSERALRQRLLRVATSARPSTVVTG
jgi:peptidoglycan/LPS O-acetylase OafA/YrhL